MFLHLCVLIFCLLLAWRLCTRLAASGLKLSSRLERHRVARSTPKEGVSLFSIIFRVAPHRSFLFCTFLSRIGLHHFHHCHDFQHFYHISSNPCAFAIFHQVSSYFNFFVFILLMFHNVSSLFIIFSLPCFIVSCGYSSSFNIVFVFSRTAHHLFFITSLFHHISSFHIIRQVSSYLLMFIMFPHFHHFSIFS